MPIHSTFSNCYFRLPPPRSPDRCKYKCKRIFLYQYIDPNHGLLDASPPPPPPPLSSPPPRSREYRRDSRDLYRR